MRVLVVTGIWPPDVGGPASHAPEVASFLAARGHRVEVVTTAEAEPAPMPYPVRFVSRRLPPGIRHAAVVRLVASRARRADVVYATSMVGRAAAATLLTGTALVVKTTTDPAYERSVRRSLYDGGLDSFERASLPPVAEFLRRLRTVTVRRASHILCSSAYFRDIVLTWGVSPDRVSVLPNTVPRYDDLLPKETLRARLGLEGKTLAFAGRLTRAKALEVALDAIAELDDVRLLVAGTGEERGRLEARAGPRVVFLGPLGRRQTTELFAAADGAVLSSSWEAGRPFSVVEALSVGTPVISTRVGGVPEVVVDEMNGLLVEPGDPAALADAVRRFFADDELRQRLADAAEKSVADLAPEQVLPQLERTLLEAADGAGR
jgi:glycosyltransferase involved in cell wall biosynthesis